MTPATTADPAGAIVSPNGTLGPLAAPARRINTLLLAYAPHLLHATSTDVWLVPAGGAARANRSHLLVVGVESKLPVLVGSFRLRDGRTAALVQNHAWQAASQATLAFAPAPAAAAETTAAAAAAAAGRGPPGLRGVWRVDPATGEEVPVLSASVGLAAGSAELYVCAR